MWKKAWKLQQNCVHNAQKMSKILSTKLWWGWGWTGWIAILWHSMPTAGKTKRVKWMGIGPSAKSRVPKLNSVRVPIDFIISSIDKSSPYSHGDPKRGLIFNLYISAMIFPFGALDLALVPSPKWICSFCVLSKCKNWLSFLPTWQTILRIINEQKSF